MPRSDDPYIPPSAMDPARDCQIHVEGNLLVIREGAVLPQRCVLSNAETDSKSGRSDVTARQFRLWHGILVALCPLLFWAVWYLSKPRVRIDYRYKKLSARGNWLVLSLVSTIAGAVLLWKGHHNPWIGSIACSLLAASSWITPLGLPLRLVKEMNGWYYLEGCCPEYLASLTAEQSNKAEPAHA